MEQIATEHPAGNTGWAQSQAAETTTSPQLASTNKHEPPQGVNVPVRGTIDIETEAGKATPGLQEAVSGAQPAVKLGGKSDCVAPAQALPPQSSSLRTKPLKPPKAPKTATRAGELPPELPSSKPGKINLEKFRLSQDLVEHAGGRKLLTVVPVRRPSKEAFFRAQADMNARMKVKVIELKDMGEVYLVDPDLWAELEGESTFVPKLLVPVITRQLALSIWPIRLPGPDGRIDDWNTSALEAAKIAVSKWVRLSPNRSLGAYDVIVGPDPQPEVVWPDYSFDEIVNIAFRDKYIDSLDHPVIRQLRP